jgi:hypothetical protein
LVLPFQSFSPHFITRARFIAKRILGLLKICKDKFSSFAFFASLLFFTSWDSIYYGNLALYNEREREKSPKILSSLLFPPLMVLPYLTVLSAHARAQTSHDDDNRPGEVKKDGRLSRHQNEKGFADSLYKAGALRDL